VKQVASFRQYQAAYVGGQAKIGKVTFGLGVVDISTLSGGRIGAAVGRGLAMARDEQAAVSGKQAPIKAMASGRSWTRILILTHGSFTWECGNAV